MRKLHLLLGFLVLTAAAPSPAQLMIGKKTAISFASVDEARKVLTSRDDFVQCLSPFDRAARMKTASEVSEADYLAFVGRNVLAWDDADREKVAAAFQATQESLAALSLPFPGKVLLIKMTGDEEGGAAYTRSNAIVLPRGDLTGSRAAIQKTICHELFHIMSRANPALREKLYAAIGFVPCNELEFPSNLKSRKITNPDAPRNDHCIRVQVGGKEHWAVPILFSSAEKYDVGRGGEFFNYLQFRFLLVERTGSSAIKPIYEGESAKFVDLQETHGFFEQVGKNTRYILHPEEILADNFALLVMRERNLPSPEIITKLEAILKQKGNAEPGAPAVNDKQP